MWLAVVGVIPRQPVPAMCLYMFLAAHAQTFFNTANVVTAVQNFPDYSGTIVGIMKGFLGLSGAILIQVYQAFFKGHPSTFILMLALLPSISSVLLMCLVRVCPGERVNDKKHLDGFSIVALVLSAYLMVVIILQNISVFPQWAHLVTCVVLFLLVSSPLKIAIDANSQEKSRAIPSERDPLIDGTDSDVLGKFVDENRGEYDELASTSNDKELIGGENMSISEAMCGLNFWLLFVSMACGMGSGLATINNMSQMGESLGYARVKIQTLVSLWSIWNFLGRFGAGYISDILLRQKGWARPLMMVLTLATMTMGHLIIAFGFVGNLYIGTILVGICYGAQWSLMPTITSEIFGVLHMGTIFNTIAVASPVGTYFLSVWVIGHLYDKEAGEGNSCFGVHCFMVSFIILASVSFFGSLVSLVLFFRTRVFYNTVVLRRLRHSLRR